MTACHVFRDTAKQRKRLGPEDVGKLKRYTFTSDCYKALKTGRLETKQNISKYNFFFKIGLYRVSALHIPVNELLL